MNNEHILRCFVKDKGIGNCGIYSLVSQMLLFREFSICPYDSVPINKFINLHDNQLKLSKYLLKNSGTAWYWWMSIKLILLIYNNSVIAAESELNCSILICYSNLYVQCTIYTDEMNFASKDASALCFSLQLHVVYFRLWSKYDWKCFIIGFHWLLLLLLSWIFEISRIL